MELIIPAVIVFVGNVFSGSPGSRRWEFFSALFGWTGGAALLLWIVCSAIGWEFLGRHILFPIGAFCLLYVVSRDYEKILKPLVDRWLKRRAKGE